MNALEAAIAGAKAMEDEAAEIMRRDLGITHPERLIECLVIAAILRFAEAYGSTFTSEGGK